MGYEGKKLVTIEFVIDTDVGYYEIGELEGLFQEHELENYIERFGHEKLCSHLAYLQFQVWSALKKINAKNSDSGKSVKTEV